MLMTMPRNRSKFPPSFVRLGAKRVDEMKGNTSDWKNCFTGPVLHSTEPAGYPIFLWKGGPDELTIDYEIMGTAFFVAESGLFLTAAHVVERYRNAHSRLRIFYVDQNLESCIHCT